MELVKFWQAQLINSDLDMYYAKTDTPAVCRTSSLVEELGQIEYIFSDKTGTLTCNEMEFQECSVYGVMYAQTVEESKREQGQKTFQELVAKARGDSDEAYHIREFLTLLSVCHTVIPEVKDDKIVYQASSPDEAALVSGAEVLGYRFHVSYAGFDAFSTSACALTICPFFPFFIFFIFYIFIKNLDLFLATADPKTEINFRQHGWHRRPIRDPQRLRIQLVEKENVHDRPWS